MTMKTSSSIPERPLKADEELIEEAIASLAGLGHAALKERWRALQGGDPPRRLSRQLLLRALAHAMQEKAFGGLSPDCASALAAPCGRATKHWLHRQLRNPACVQAGHTSHS